MLVLRFSKRSDGSALLRCVRANGSAAWQKQEGAHASFFPLHDLMHYAVETELGFKSGFYGLIAEGWEIADTTGKAARGPLPTEALEVEYVVAALSAERAGGAAATADEFNELAATFASANKMPVPRRLTDEDLTRVRARFDELATEWRALPRGTTMDLGFPLL